MSEPPNSPDEPDSPDDHAFVIGGEYAAASSAEQRHQDERGNQEPSPLEGIGYDFWAGHHDLLTLAPSPADEKARILVTSYQGAGAEEASRIRDALTMDDFYTLLTFARRSAVRALRTEDRELARDAVMATALIESERVDWRDILVALGLATYALRALSADPDGLIAQARAMAEPSTAELMGRFIDVAEEDADPAAWGYLPVETADGVGFVEHSIAEYNPTVNLIGVALQIAEVINGDAYRVSSITAAGELAPVWLPGASPSEADVAIDACRGCVTINARLEPGANARADAQQLTAFIVEAANEPAARQLNDWARPADPSSHQAVSVDHGTLMALLIARSFVQDVEPFETAESLARFRDPLDTIVAAAAGN